jgi:IS1 family transposase
LRFSDLTQRAQRKVTESTESLAEGTYDHELGCQQCFLFGSVLIALVLVGLVFLRVLLCVGIVLFGAGSDKSRTGRIGETPASFMANEVRPTIAEHIFVNNYPVKEQDLVGIKHFVADRPSLDYGLWDYRRKNVEIAILYQKAVIGIYERTAVNWLFRERIRTVRENMVRSPGYEFSGSPSFIRDSKRENFFGFLEFLKTYNDPRTFGINDGLSIQQSSFRGVLRRSSLTLDDFQGANSNNDPCDSHGAQNEIREVFRRNETKEIGLRFLGVFIGIIGGICLLLYVELVYFDRIPANRIVLWGLRGGGGLLLSIGFFSGLLPVYWDYDATYGCQHEHHSHSWNTVPHKYRLTSPNYWGTVISIGRTNMAPFLDRTKQVAIISALAEGSGIRQIERMTGVHRDTIMRLGVRVGQGCADLLDGKMRNLICQHLQFDEVWGFIGKKQKHVLPDDNPDCGDVWTFCAIDSDTKLVPSFKVGKRDSVTANAFVGDVASRLKNRVQVSTDSLHAYVQAVEQAFGANVDYAQIVKVFDDQSMDAEVIGMKKTAFTGRPNMTLASTSHVERLNGTTRLHMRRLTRLTYAFSKKKENFEAAVALHFAYYNFVKRHNTLRATPAMAAGIERAFWTVGDLVEATA